MVNAEILNSHPVSTLKKELKATNIKGIAKMKKSEVVAVMLKRKEMFTHIKHRTAPAAAAAAPVDRSKKVRIIKPKKEQPNAKQKTMVDKAIEKKAKAAKKDKYEIKPFVSKFVPTYTKQEQEMMKQVEMAENHANRSSDQVIDKFDKLASSPEHDKEYKQDYEELLGKWRVVSLTPDVYAARFPERVKKLKKLGKKFKYSGEYSFKAYGI